MNASTRNVLLGLGALILMSGCSVSHFGGYLCSPPINCAAVQGTVDPPKFAQNLYDMQKRPIYDKSRLGYVQYNPIGKKTECRLGRSVLVEVPNNPPQILTCDFGAVFRQFIIPLEMPTFVSLKYISPEGQILCRATVPVMPDIRMLKDYHEEYGWRVIIKPGFDIEVRDGQKYRNIQRYDCDSI